MASGRQSRSAQCVTFSSAPILYHKGSLLSASIPPISHAIWCLPIIMFCEQYPKFSLKCKNLLLNSEYTIARRRRRSALFSQEDISPFGFKGGHNETTDKIFWTASCSDWEGGWWCRGYNNRKEPSHWIIIEEFAVKSSIHLLTTKKNHYLGSKEAMLMLMFFLFLHHHHSYAVGRLTWVIDSQNKLRLDRMKDVGSFISPVA